MNGRFVIKIGLVSFVALAFAGYFYFDLGESLSFQALKQNQESLQNQFSQNPFWFGSLFFAMYVFVTGLSIPGAAVLTLAAGAIFGLLKGTLIVSFASTLGASFAFLGARFVLRDFFEKKFSQRLLSINQGIQKEGLIYLFTLRLVPAVPFFLVNILMGLTQMSLASFFWVSQVGMLAGTLVYVNAGSQLANIESPKDIFSAQMLVSFFVLALFPWIGKKAVETFKARKFLAAYKTPSTFDYNMVVIGAGSAGLVSAYIASALQAKVALIEKHKMGGDCLNTGCVPSKALIRSAKIYSYLKRAEEFGFEKVNAKVDFQKVMERVHSVVKSIAPHDSVERYTKLGVECIQGAAQVLSPYEVQVNNRILTTKNIVIATGARPYVPPIPGLKDGEFLTSDTVWNLKELPQKMLILGGGPIGCELAQCFVRFGSQVTVVEKASRLMSKEDRDVSEVVESKFKAEGVEVCVSHQAMEVVHRNNKKFLVCQFEGSTKELEFDSFLIALGRKANVSGFGLEKLQLELRADQTLAANEYLQATNYPNIYVCGDVTGPFQLTHAASHQAWYVAVNALLSPFKKFKADYRVIPWCTFTDPEVARVGLSEAEAQNKKIAYDVTKYNIDDLDRAIADGEAHGFVKVLTRQGTDQILGATIVGDHAGEIIAEYVTAMKHGLGLNKILGTIHIYPTFAEANKYAAGVWKRNNAPKRILKLLKLIHRWRRN